MTRPVEQRLGRACAIGFAAAFLVAGGARAEQTGADARTVPSIAVTGHATVSVVPDVAVVTIGVESERPRAAEAMAENNRTAQRLLDTVKAAGVEPRDVATTSVALDAIYDSPAKGTPKLTGYHAALNMQVRVKPIDKAGALVSALTDAGANSIDGIDFVASPNPGRDDQLRADATRDARHAAGIYADAIGVKLGRVLSIAPGEIEKPEPRTFERSRHVRAKVAAAADVPLAAGSQDQTADVTVTFEILQ